MGLFRGNKAHLLYQQELAAKKYGFGYEQLINAKIVITVVIEKKKKKTASSNVMFDIFPCEGSELFQILENLRWL